MIPGSSIAPTLFDAATDPDLFMPLVLANLMSPRLWKLRERVRQEPDDDLPFGLRRAQQVINRHFTHLTGAQVVELYGELDLAEESARLGGDSVAAAVASIERTIRRRIERGTLPPDDATVALIRQGRFPAFTYAPIDVLYAHRKLGRISGRPHGLTSCVDEAALLAALLMTEDVSQLDGIAVLSIPAHTTVFGWSGGEGWWFYGKNALFSRADFAAAADGDLPSAFEERMDDLNRIVSRRGTFALDLRTSSIPPDEIHRTSVAIEQFFGHRPSALTRSLERGVRHVPPSPFDQLFEQCLDRRDAAEVREVVRSAAAGSGPLGAPAVAALHCYRSLDVPDLSPYLARARRCLSVGEPAPLTLDGVLDFVATRVPGAVSIFADEGRIAMPDETLRLATGSHRDRALLIHTLLERSGDRIETLLGEHDSVVCGSGFQVSAATLESAHVPAQGRPLG